MESNIIHSLRNPSHITDICMRYKYKWLRFVWNGSSGDSLDMRIDLVNKNVVYVINSHIFRATL